MPIKLLSITEFNEFTSTQLEKVCSVDIRFSRVLTPNDHKLAASVYDIALFLSNQQDCLGFCNVIKNCHNLSKLRLPREFDNIKYESQIEFLERILLANITITQIRPLHAQTLPRALSLRFNTILSGLKARYLRFIQKQAYRNTYSQYIKMFDIIDTLESKALSTKSSHHAFSDFQKLKKSTCGFYEQPYYVSDKEVNDATDQGVQSAINEVVAMRKFVHPIRTASAPQTNTVAEQAKAVSHYKHYSIRHNNAPVQKAPTMTSEYRPVQPPPLVSSSTLSTHSSKQNLSVRTHR